MKNKIAILAFTSQGLELGRSLCERFDADLYVPLRLAGDGARGFDSLKSVVDELFHGCDGLVFISACGIAVRAIAPLLVSKTCDPAVVVLDQKGENVISLVSGHLGGANDLARSIAGITGGQAIITTATDIEGAPAIDSMAAQNGLRIANPERIKIVNSALAEGRMVRVYDPLNSLALDKEQAGYFKVVDTPDELEPGPSVLVGPCLPLPGEEFLVLTPKILVAGIGCRRGATSDQIITALKQALETQNLSPASLLRIASVDIKADEPGLLEAAEHLRADMVFFAPQELKNIKVPTPSEMVDKHIGVRSVCEAAALLSARTDKLLVKKQIRGPVTVAVAQVS